MRTTHGRQPVVTTLDSRSSRLVRLSNTEKVGYIGYSLAAALVIGGVGYASYQALETAPSMVSRSAEISTNPTDIAAAVSGILLSPHSSMDLNALGICSYQLFAEEKYKPAQAAEYQAAGEALETDNPGCVPQPSAHGIYMDANKVTELITAKNVIPNELSGGMAAQQ